MNHAYEVLVDCLHCRVEGAVVQIFDPSDPEYAAGTPVSEVCRLCGAPGAPLDVRDRDVARAALGRWAAGENATSVDDFCRANMGASADEVVEALAAGRAVATLFDVIAYLFPSKGGHMAASAMPEVVDRDPAQAVAIPAAPPKPSVPDDPLACARALVSVMSADGVVQDAERDFVRRWLEAEKLPHLDPLEWRVYRPTEVQMPADAALRARAVEACVQLAHVDSERDGSEWHVVVAYGRAWGIAEGQLEAWSKAYGARYATPLSRLWQRLDGVVRIR